ncbi:hypothetical protein B0H10DRAFT_1971616 [Mycena sp. CBHHK59/15]|nr:hypothetical protein B0H10DRAFT_1971616 [Mycena sp. CBHHK59/15]
MSIVPEAITISLDVTFVINTQGLGPLLSTRDKSCSLRIFSRCYLSRKNEKTEMWSILPNLMKKLSSFIQVFVSLTTTSYSGLNKAMRKCKVKVLPNKDDVVAVGLVLVKIQSTEKESPIANVTTLANKLLKNTNVKATVQFYQRVALICWCITNFPMLTDDEFWLKGVNKSIAQFCKDSQSDEELNKCFNTIYEDDKVKYGDPTETEYKIINIKMTPAWQQMSRKHANNIQPAPKETPGPAHKKCRIDDMDTDDSVSE